MSRTLSLGLNLQTNDLFFQSSIAMWLSSQQGASASRFLIYQGCKGRNLFDLPLPRRLILINFSGVIVHIVSSKRSNKLSV